MRLGLLLCAFGLHRWRHFDEPYVMHVGKREVPMKASRRQCERCRLLQGYNRLGPLSDWYEINPVTGKAQ